MSDVELSIDIQLKLAQTKLDALGKSMNQVADKGRAVGAANKQAAKDSEKAFGSMATSIKRLSLAWVSVAGAQKAYQLAHNSAKSADTIAMFENAGGSIEKLRKATKGLISDATLAKNANLARTMGITAEEFSKLSVIANAAAKSTGESTMFMMESIVKGTARSSKLLVDNTGLIVTVGEANKVYAEQLGKTSAALSDAEKKQAFINAAIAAGEPLTEAAAAAGATNAEAYDRFAASMENLAIAFGHSLRPAVEGIINPLNQVAALLDRISGKEKGGAVQKRVLQSNIDSLQAMAAAEADKFAPIDGATGRRRFLSPVPLTENQAAAKKRYTFLQAEISRLTNHWKNEEIKAQKAIDASAAKSGGSRTRGRKSNGSNGSAYDAWISAQYAGSGGGAGTLSKDGSSFASLDPFLARQLHNEEMAQSEGLSPFPKGNQAKDGGEFYGADPFAAEYERKLDLEAELKKQKIIDARELADHELKMAREVAEAKRQQQAEYVANAQMAIGIGVDLMTAATDMIINQEKHILERLTAMGLARVGQEFVAKGSLLAAEGLGLTIMSHGADPAGYAAMGQGAAMIGTGMAMGAGGMMINKALGAGSSGGDSVSAGAITNRGNGAQSIGASNQTQIVVNYGVNGPHPDETARAVKDALNLANRRAMR